MQDKSDRLLSFKLQSFLTLCVRARNSPTGRAKAPNCSALMLLNSERLKLPIIFPLGSTIAKEDKPCKKRSGRAYH